jgi:hypothetical protein
MAENHLIVSKGFDLLLGVFAPYITGELSSEYGKDWWNVAVLDKLYDVQKRNLPASGKTIPDSVTHIDLCAFYNNPLVSITIGDNVAMNGPTFNFFDSFYVAHGRRAGTYTRLDSYGTEWRWNLPNK